MGEVYRANDSRLRRAVAIKVLPDDLAGDRERLARFEREAHLLASLNHPNIGAIYGLEESGGKRCLVLELIEGRSLSERNKEGPVPVKEALAIGEPLMPWVLNSRTETEFRQPHAIPCVHRTRRPV